MNILLNLFPVKSGGGQQTAMSFIQILRFDNFGHRWFFFVGKHSELYTIVNLYFDNERIISMPYSYVNRLIAIPKIKRFIKTSDINIVYNFTIPICCINVPQVVRSVYSNIYFPEINFWEGHTKITRLKKYIVDYFRLNGTLKADGIIFENKSMQERIQKLYSYPLSNTTYIRPAVSHFDENDINSNYNYIAKINKFKILYLSNFYLNKNIHILPHTAKILKDWNIEVVFILSLNPELSEIAKYLINPIRDMGLNDYFEFIDNVKAGHVHQVVKNCDALILLSKLECFSSNITEAFFFHKLLFISDEEWSRSECVNGAVYVNRNNPLDIATKIAKYINQPNLSTEIISNANHLMKTFNTPYNRFKNNIEFLEYIYHQNK